MDAQTHISAVPPESEGTRVDVYLAAALEVSRAEAQRLLEGGHAAVNGATARPSLRLKAGDRVEAVRPPPAPSTVQGEAIPLNVVFEDPDLLVIDKPRGMVVHPAPGNASGTLVNAVLAHADDLSGIGGEERPGIVHRLDKDTSGLLVVAKTDAAHRSLQAQIQARTAERRYLAVVWGSPDFERALVEAPIGRHPGDRKRMAVVTEARHGARDAVTELAVRERMAGFTLLEAGLRTGRTHQIRVHCEYINHPVVGDPVYGGNRRVGPRADRETVAAAISALGGQALHAHRLAFDHPGTGERLVFEAPLPAVMDSLLATLRSAGRP